MAAECLGSSQSPWPGSTHGGAPEDPALRRCVFRSCDAAVCPRPRERTWKERAERKVGAVRPKAPITWAAAPHGGGPRAPASRPAELPGRARRRGGRMRRGARRLCPAARVSMERRRPRLLRRTLRLWRWRPFPTKWTSSPPRTGG